MKLNAKFCLGVTIIALLLLAAVLAPYLATFDPAENNLLGRLAPPGPEHILGTDHLGRDVYSRILYGARLTLRMSGLILLISMLFGTAVGLLSGYFGGTVDSMLMSVVDILLAFPNMILALAVAGIAGVGLKNTVIALCFVSWTGYARMVRNLVLSLREQDYVKAALIGGSSHGKILIRHIFPHILTPVLVYAGTHIGSIAMQISALSFLGLGVQPPIAEWGSMLNEAKGYITAAPWLTIYPSIMLIATVTGFNLLGEGISQMAGVSSERQPVRRKRYV